MPLKDLAARKEYCRKKYERDRESILAKQKIYSKENAVKINARGATWRRDNKEVLAQKEAARRVAHNAETLARYHANAEVWRARAREWKTANRDACIAYKKQWDEENRKHVSEAGRKYRAANAEKVSLCFRNWRLRNHEKMLAHANRRRAIVKGSEGQFTDREIMALLDKQGGRCVYFAICGNDLSRAMHRDHIEPLVPMDRNRAPGRNTIDNIQLLCQKCNNRKKNHDPYKFTQEYVGMLFPDLPPSGPIPMPAGGPMGPVQ